MASLYYTGTYGEQNVWKYDIGYAAEEIKTVSEGFIAELENADPAVETTELSDVATKAEAVLTAAKEAVVQSWRTSKGNSESLYDELVDEEDNAIPYGITITGALIAETDTLTVPTDGKTPDGYSMAFGTTYAHWAALLMQWFN